MCGGSGGVDSFMSCKTPGLLVHLGYSGVDKLQYVTTSVDIAGY